jgi:hypothetical protein
MTKPNGSDADDSLRAQVESYLSQVDALIRRGRELREQLSRDPSSVSAIASTRLWQEHCGVTVNQLSGGSKAHWLARSFSEAFLMRSVDGQALDAAAPKKIVDRLLQVLQQAVTSLSSKDESQVLSTSAPLPRRFDFVHNAELRPILERAYAESRDALDAHDYDVALRTSCGILEALVTDALEYKGLADWAAYGAPSGAIADWSFQTRLAVAEKAGLIRGGWARLTEAARKYRDQAADTLITETDARRASQVLNVIMRDLNPGR